MNGPALEVPDEVRRKALLQGPQGAAWLRDLARIIAEIEVQWGLRVGRSLRGGSESFVAEVLTAEGEDAILKIAIPGLDPDASEARTLIAAAGRGYVRVFRYDRRRGALLLERLGRKLHDLDLPVDAQIEIVCRTLHEAWMAPPEGLKLMSGAEKAKRLAAFIDATWADLGRPCAERTVETALAYAKLRAEAFDPEASVLAHGDAHAWNTLQASGSPARFKLIDPDGLIAERAYDLAIPMREWSAELLAGDPVVLGRRRCERLSRLGGVAPEPIWQWALIERVSTGLLLCQMGLEALAAEYLQVADAWAEGA